MMASKNKSHLNGFSPKIMTGSVATSNSNSLMFTLVIFHVLQTIALAETRL